MQHEPEQLLSDHAKQAAIDVQPADDGTMGEILPQPLHGNPAHRPRRRAGHRCEQQLAWRVALALDAAAQGHTAQGPIVSQRGHWEHLWIQIRFPHCLHIDHEAEAAQPCQLSSVPQAFGCPVTQDEDLLHVHGVW